jgi:formate dehydrogenase subunit gamma
LTGRDAVRIVADDAPSRRARNHGSLPLSGPLAETPSADAVEQAVDAALSRHRGRPGALLPLLHDVQDSLGHIPDTAVPKLAQALNLSRAEVHGVVTYYHHFRTTPPGRHVVQVCRAEACQALGADALLAHAERALGCGVHATRADGAVSLEPVFCLGLCALSPAVMVDDRLHGRVTPQRLDAIAAELGIAADAPVAA